MDNIIKQISIDLYSPTSYEVIYAQQGDNSSRVIEFILYDKGEPYAIPQNTLIRMEGHRGDHSSFIKENCTLSDNVIRATLDDDILYAHGIVEAKIILTQRAEKESSESNGNSHDVILSTIPFRIHVQKNPCDKTKVEAEKRSLIDYLIQKLRELKDTLTTHISDKTNPHNVTKAQVGLGNADNTADKDKYVASANQLTTPRTIDGVSFNGTKSIAHYCICPSLGNAAAKTASLPGFQLVNGAKAAVLFQYGNTAASPTLTVNNTGAKPIHYNGEAISLANAPILKGCCEFVYDGLGHWLLTGRHTFVKGASETAYRDGLVSLTPADIGASPSGHTHSYAGSASPGGSATSANKLNTDAGSQKQPVYFKNGIPIACEDISNYQEVTQAEYERLTASEKEDVVFYITDADNSIPTASDTEKGLVTVDRTLSLTSENPVQNKAIKAELDRKVDKASGKGLSTNDYTTAEKTKLAGVAANANNYSLPLASTSMRGGVKVGYAENGKNYPVELSDEKMFVNVPWTDTNTTYSVGKQLESTGTAFRLKDFCTTVTDWNNATTNGWYMASGATNAPVASTWLYGIVVAHNSQYVRQILYAFSKDSNVSGTNCDRYERIKQNGTWGSWVNTSVRKAVPSNAVFTDTTYPYYKKAIDASFATKFRTETKGSAGYGNYISNIRTEASGVENAPQYGAGLAWGSEDTHSYLNISYSGAAAYIGGGNADKLNWIKQLAFMDSNVASATKATQDGNGKTISSTYVKKSGDTLSGSLQVAGESKFHQGAYSDPWPSHSCAIKAVGDIGVSGTIKTGKIQVSSRGGNWIEGMTLSNASIGISDQNSVTGYHPILAGKTKSNHIWNIGTIMDRAGFYGFKSGRTENNRDWAFDIDVTTGAVTSTGSITAPSFIGNASSATKATQDGNGNVISSSYAIRKTISSGSFNDLTAPGLYTVSGSSVTNKPDSSSYWGLIVLQSTASSSNYVEQIAIKENSHSIYTRYKNGSSWSAWKRLLNEDDATSSSASENKICHLFDGRLTSSSTSLSFAIPSEACVKKETIFISCTGYANGYALHTDVATVGALVRIKGYGKNGLSFCEELYLIAPKTQNGTLSCGTVSCNMTLSCTGYFFNNNFSFKNYGQSATISGWLYGAGGDNGTVIINGIPSGITITNIDILP